MDAMIFDVQRGSLVDGPGVRTTVFFKGCNLRCQWCHNPESQSPESELMLHRNRCTQCGICARVCPNHLEHCDRCGKCADLCPNDARELCGWYMSPEKLFKMVCRDESYFRDSGGGVTCSGGECMLQIEPLTELLRLCNERGIHTAVDTAGCVPWTSFEQLLPYTDLFLYDLKCCDERIHRRYTGVSNELILDNLGRLAQIDPDRILVRIPVIPGVNTTDEEMHGMAALLKARSIRHAELLPYHRMGEHKYEDLGREAVRFPVPTDSEMARCRAFFSEISG